MCGIAGIVRYAGGVDRDRLTGMRDRLRHRGPDGEGLYLAPRVGLAHTRLALVDPAHGAQPMTSPDGRFVLVYNGEVYNAAELRAELADGWQFETRCDAEVVLAAYARWGEACVPRFNGMFAFFVWDAVAETGFAARDLMGVKPFVYAHDGGELIFASEAKAILTARSGRPVARMSALLEYLVVPCFSGVETPMFDGLAYLPPGHVMRVTRDGVEIAAWGRYELDPRDDVSPDELAAALGRAVARTLIADAPVGVFLSGGLDSTAIAALCRRAGASPRAFTIAFEDQAAFDYARSRIVISDDGPFAALAATELGLEHHIVSVPRATLALDLAAIARIDDALPAWEQELAQHHLSRAAAASCKAVLVGDAADETHYGYHFLLDDEATRSPRGLIERFASPIVRADVLADPVAHFDGHYRALAGSAGHDWDGDPHARTLATTWLVVHRWLPRLLHNGDIHAMAWSLEARVPFADVELLALARRLGPRRQLAGGVEKAALREALTGSVPEPIRTRRKSALPKDQETAAIYRREAIRVLDDLALDGLVDRPRARALCDGRSLDERDRALLFRLICLGHWARTYDVRLP